MLKTPRTPHLPGVRALVRRPAAQGWSHMQSHASVAMTLDTYSHTIPAMQDEAAALIAGPVFAAK
jgi:hypothetical protein